MPVFIVLITLLLGACARPAADGWPPCPDPVFDTQGHRGARAYRPENTLPAMSYALDRGVRTMEMDVSVTGDDVLVLSHDPHLLPDLCLSPDGTPAEKVPIRSLTLRQLQGYDCGSLMQPRFPNQVPVPGTPPTLEEVFALAEKVSGGTIRYSIETKIDPSWDPALTPTPARFAELIEQALAAAGVTRPNDHPEFRTAYPGSPSKERVSSQDVPFGPGGQKGGQGQPVQYSGYPPVEVKSNFIVNCSGIRRSVDAVN
jgi:glycerophosphoryl diester phosphodiesterase